MTEHALTRAITEVLRNHYSGAPQTHRQVAHKIQELIFEKVPEQTYIVERWGPPEPQQNS